jgi:hypothetical protein
VNAQGIVTAAFPDAICIPDCSGPPGFFIYAFPPNWEYVVLLGAASEVEGEARAWENAAAYVSELSLGSVSFIKTRGRNSTAGRNPLSRSGPPKLKAKVKARIEARKLDRWERKVAKWISGLPIYEG